MKNYLKMAAAFLFAIAMLVSFSGCAERIGGGVIGGAVDDGGDADVAPEQDFFAEPFAPRERGDAVGPGIPVALVNGMEIGMNDVSGLVMQAQSSLEMNPDIIFGPTDIEGQQAALREEMVRIAAIIQSFYNFGAENDMLLSPEERAEIWDMINAEIEWYFEGDADAFLEALAENGVTSFEHYERMITGFFTMNNVILEIMDNPEVFAQFEGYMSESDIVPYEGELLGAMHILINHHEFGHFADADMADGIFDMGNWIMDEEAAMEFALEIRDRALAGEDFEDLMWTYSRDQTGLASFPEGYTFRSGEMAVEFEEGTRALAIGEIGEPIMSQHGIHIVKRIEPNPENLMEVTMDRMERMHEAIYLAFEAMVDNAEIIFLPEFYDIPLV
jgi:hypothetical protein